MKKKIIITAALGIASTAFGGIYRHDVSPEKYKKLATQKQFDCVGLVMDNFGQNAKGTCVLIGNKYVLSAAHVFMTRDIRVDTFYFDKNGKRNDKQTEGGAIACINTPINERPGMIENFSFRFNRHRYTGKQFKINQSYLDSLSNRNIFCGDLVLIELDDTVAGVTPATLNTDFDEKNAIVTGVGYGISGPADKPDDVGPFLEKIAGQNVIDKVEGFEVGGKGSLLSSDFDAPGRADCNKMGSAKPLPLEWSPGSGDSGGGLFRQVNNRWQLVGIITGGPNSGWNMQGDMKTRGYYGGITQNARVSVFNDWIKQTIADFDKSEMKVNIWTK